MKKQAIIRIVDNDKDHCEGLKFLLFTENWKVRIFTSGVDFLRSKDWASPGCIILDYKMPDITGIELQELLIKEGCKLPIIFLTAHADVDMAIHVFKKGAKDLFKKPVQADELFEAIEEAVERDFKSRQIPLPSPNSKYDQLSPREKQVIDLALIGLMNSQIARRLNLSERTVEVHRANAYRRLGITNISQLTQNQNSD